MPTTLTLTQDIFIGGVRQVAGSVITVNDSLAGSLISENKALRPADFGLDFNEQIFIPSSNDYAGILRAYNQAVAAGGGTVKLAPVTYNMGGNSLPMAGGIWYEGSGWNVDATSNVLTGTVMIGDGTAPCFWDGKTDNAVPFPTDPAFTADRTVEGGGITKMAFRNFSYAIKSGALYRAGVRTYAVDDIYLDTCTEWFLWFENSSYSRFLNIYTGTVGFVNGLFFGCSSGAVYNNTNNHYEHITLDTLEGTLKSRYLVMGCRAPNTAVNDTCMYNIQVNSGTNNISFTGTPAGGASADVSVPNGSLLAIDLPVIVKTTVNGLQSYITYFIKTIVGNTITLALKPGGTAITFASTTALPLFSYGFPHIEFATSFEGSDLTACQIQPFTLSGMDFEGGATTSILVVDGNGTMQQGTHNGQGQGVDIATNYCLRNSSVVITNSNPCLYDFDGSSAGSSILNAHAFDNGSNTPFPNSTPLGLIRSFGRGAIMLNLANRGLGANARLNGLLGVNPSGGNFIYPYGSIGQSVQASTSASLNMSGTHLGAIAFTGTANATWTLPTLAGVIGSNSYFGGVFEIANASTTAGVVLTLNSAAGQGFNRQSKTSYSLALGQSISVRAMTDGTNFWWQVTGNNGAT
jgi:hypothetical protein